MRLSRCAAVLFLSLGCLAQERSSGPTFEVASVKPAKPNAQPANLRGGPGTVDPGTFTVDSFSLKDLITLAWHLRSFQVSGPAWIDNTRYDIVAKAAVGATKDDRNLMLQSLLAERFSLKFHYEKKVHAAYELVVDKRGFKLRPPAKETDLGEVNRGILAMAGQKNFVSLYDVEGGRGVTDINATVEEFGRILENQLDEGPVVDKTGLSGRYDFRIRFAQANGGGDSALPSLFTAVEECCGLKLEPVRRSFDVMVIDHIEPPSEN